MNDHNALFLSLSDINTVAILRALLNTNSRWYVTFPRLSRQIATLKALKFHGGK